MNPMEEQIASVRLERAIKKVEMIKDFHLHILLYVVASVFVLAFKREVIGFVAENTDGANPAFLDWLDWNMIAIPIIWGAVLAVHGVYVFTPSIIRSWEEAKIQKYMQQEKGNFITHTTKTELP